MKEQRALTELKQVTSRVALPVDKGVAMVITDKQDYINKAHPLLADTNSYRISTEILQINSKTNSYKHSRT